MNENVMLRKGMVILMKLLNKETTVGKERPIKVVQFGEGNFLRGFVDEMIDIANEKGVFDGNVVMIKPKAFGNLDRFHRQDCRYTVSLRGIVDGEPKILNRVITSVEDVVDPGDDYEKYLALAELDTLRFVVSNTTEAGIVFDSTDTFESKPPKSFPGKLTKFLYHRFAHFHGDAQKGLVMLPVELIEDNGIVLEKYVQGLAKLWNLGEDFSKWVSEACIFTSTLVDRIVPGYPADTQEEEWESLGYEDRLLVVGEPFALWVIESKKDISKDFPLPSAGLPVIFTENQKPYKQRKVRVLNGAHTSFALASYLCGNDYVRESMEDEDVYAFMHKIIYDEVIPSLTMPRGELYQFAEAVIARFRNPYVKHALLSISLNSVSKWRARCLPSLLEYVKLKDSLPEGLSFSLAALMAFYDGEWSGDKSFYGYRAGEEYSISDDESVLAFFGNNGKTAPELLTAAFLSKEEFWGEDLNKIPGLTDTVAAYLADIRTNGMRTALCKLL